jgi:hypothetical protein
MSMVIIEMDDNVFVRVSEDEAKRLGKSPVALTATLKEPKNKKVKPESKKVEVKVKDEVDLDA